MSKLFSLQGRIYTAMRLSNGKPGPMTWVGNAPTCQVKFTTETSDKTESFSGNKLQYGRLQKGKRAEVSLVLDEFLTSNLLLGLYGTKVAGASGTVTNESFPTGLVVGDIVRLDKPFVSSVVITDSAAGPATLTAGTHYKVKSDALGLIEILDVAAFTQPFKAAYSNAASETITMFTSAPPERFLLLDGINTENNQPVLMELPRVLFDPVGQLDLIMDDYGNLPLNGTALYDELNSADANMGGFGRIRQKVT